MEKAVEGRAEVEMVEGGMAEVKGVGTAAAMGVGKEAEMAVVTAGVKVVA